jgi:Uma2 family endonuclease
MSRRFTVPEYHRLIESGVLTKDDRLELLEGWLVRKSAENPPHDSAIQLAQEAIGPLLPPDWRIRVQSAITLSDSEPEPDLAVVRGNARSYAVVHPRAADIGLLIESSDTTLAGDRFDKGRIYARAGIVLYWIINLCDRQVETYAQPSGPGAAPAYADRAIYQIGASVPLILDGVTVAMVPVRDLLP